MRVLHRRDYRKLLKTSGRRKEIAEKILARLLYGLLAALVVFIMGYEQGFKEALYQVYMEMKIPEAEASR